MSASKILQQIKSNEIYKLVYNNTVIGLRLKYFNPDSNSFIYCDFSLNAIKDYPNIKNYINSIHKNLPKIEMYYINEQFLSEEEKNYKITEIKDVSTIAKLLNNIKLVKETYKEVTL